MHVLAVFGWIDWGVVGIYFAVVLTIGFLVGHKRKRKESEPEEYFLAGRSLPTWAIAISLVATMLSATTFVGVPDIAYAGDISYLILNLGGILAAFIVAAFFVPRLYRAGTVTIYGFLAQRYGENARLAVSCAFIFGRLLSSGARLFTAAIPLCFLLFRDQPDATSPAHLIAAIALIGVIGTFYATMGGVRAVVWVDTIQFAIVMGTALLTIGILLHRLPLSIPQIVDALSHPPAAAPSKLRLLDTSFASDHPYTLWAALIGNTFFMTAAFGVDHDLAQRFLIAKSALKGGFSVIASQCIGIVVVSLFLLIGLLLYLFYTRPDIAGGTHPHTADGRSIYPQFLINELPTGLCGLSIAGFFAIAQGSLDSAMNAVASSIVADLYLPLRNRFQPNSPTVAAKASKPTVATVGLVMMAFAMLCAAAYNPKNHSILDFVLGLMSFALSGMLGVFLTALFTHRGNSATVILALLAGAGTILLLQDGVMHWWTPKIFGESYHLAWPWWTPLGTMVAFLACARRKTVR